MRVLLQRVKRAQVTVDNQVVGSISQGLLLLVGLAPTDTDAEMDWMTRKLLSLRVFSAVDSDRHDLSVGEIQGELLVVSQFTLYGDCSKGRRPSFSQAAPPAQAEDLYNCFVQKLRQASSLRVETGIFGAMMAVDLTNDGPVTLWLEREAAP